VRAEPLTGSTAGACLVALKDLKGLVLAAGLAQGTHQQLVEPFP
jgi:hypothetical protein